MVTLKILRSFYNWAKQANPNFHVKNKQKGIYNRASELVNMWFGEGGASHILCPIHLFLLAVPELYPFMISQWS